MNQFLLTHGTEVAQQSLRAGYFRDSINKIIDALEGRGELTPDGDLDTEYNQLLKDFQEQVAVYLGAEFKPEEGTK